MGWGIKETTLLPIIANDLHGDFVFPILTTFVPVGLEGPCSHRGLPSGHLRLLVPVDERAQKGVPTLPDIVDAYHYEEVNLILNGGERNIFGIQLIY